VTDESKDPDQAVRDMLARARKQRAETLQRAKEDAARRGKEPFDLAKLEKLVDTTREGRVDPEPARQQRFEELYYVDYPDVMTIETFAEKVAELNRWS
jgi:hypothetical protein